MSKILQLKLFFIICIIGLLGCSTKTGLITLEKETIRTVTVQDPGSVEYVWEPPIVDVVDVPPGLDPSGTYYRPAHQEVVEIRPGRWRYKQMQDVKKTVNIPSKSK